MESQEAKQELDLKKEEGAHYIYLLSDPTTKTPFYVGASHDPITRLGQHLSLDANLQANRNLELYLILRRLKDRFLIPTLTILEVTTKENRTEREVYWINHYYNTFPYHIVNIDKVNGFNKFTFNNDK